MVSMPKTCKNLHVECRTLSGRWRRRTRSAERARAGVRPVGWRCSRSSSPRRSCSVTTCVTASPGSTRRARLALARRRCFASALVCPAAAWRVALVASARRSRRRTRRLATAPGRSRTRCCRPRSAGAAARALHAHARHRGSAVDGRRHRQRDRRRPLALAGRARGRRRGRVLPLWPLALLGAALVAAGDRRCRAPPALRAPHRARARRVPGARPLPKRAALLLGWTGAAMAARVLPPRRSSQRSASTGRSSPRCS